MSGPDTWPITMISYFYLDPDMTAMDPDTAAILLFFVKFVIGAEGQAIASNTFNICICLALLWFVHGLGAGTCDYGYHQGYAGQCAGCYAPSGFAPLCPYYEGTNNEYGSAAGSTKGAVLVVFVWYAVFLITLVVGRNSVGIVPAAIMFVMYLVYITYEFVAAYVPEIAICFGSINICI